MFFAGQRLAGLQLADRHHARVREIDGGLEKFGCSDIASPSDLHALN